MRRFPVSGLVGLAVALATGAASADQFVLVDADYVHTKESHAYATPGPGQPANWKTPIDYANGTAYYRLEVFEKPSTENLNMGVCFVGGSYCCFGYQRFTKPGVYEWSSPIPTMWQFDTMDWSKKITEVPFIMRDRDAIKVDSTEKYYGAPSTALYFPMRSHLTVTIVSKGGTFVKPDAGPSTDAGSDAGDASVADAGKDAAIDKDASIADATSGDAAIDARDGGVGADAGDAPADTSESSGCATSARGSSTSGAILLVLGLAFVGRRRRAA
jgi:MYXO-CTERM domain-containing protein